ncbi:MAG: hypothetical protein Q4D98_13265 [Planctomycetia bacterium]|nr:hypothetical protein [Planctomycetia bacterium]
MRTNRKSLSSAIALGILVWGNISFAAELEKPKMVLLSEEAWEHSLGALEAEETVPVYQAIDFSIADPRVQLLPKARRLSRVPARKGMVSGNHAVGTWVTAAQLEKAIPATDTEPAETPTEKVPDGASREKFSFGLEKMEIFQEPSTKKTEENDGSSTSMSTSMSTTEPAPVKTAVTSESEYVVQAVATVRSVPDIQTNGILQVQFLENLEDASVFDLAPPQNGREPAELSEPAESAEVVALETVVQEAETETTSETELVSETDERLLVPPAVTKTRLERHVEEPETEPEPDVEKSEKSAPDVELPTLEEAEAEPEPEVKAEAEVRLPVKKARLAEKTEAPAEESEIFSEAEWDVLTEEITRRAVSMISEQVVERAVRQASERILQQVGKRIQSEKVRRDSEIAEERQRQREIVRKRIEAEVSRRVAQALAQQKAEEASLNVTSVAADTTTKAETKTETDAETKTEKIIPLPVEETVEIPSDLPTLAEVPAAVEEAAQTHVGYRVEEPITAEAAPSEEPESPGFVKISKKAKKESPITRRSPATERQKTDAMPSEPDDEAGFVRIGGKKKKPAVPAPETPEEPEIPVYQAPEITSAPMAEPEPEPVSSVPEVQKLVLKPCGGVLLNTLYPVRTIRVENRNCCDTVGLSPRQVSLIGKRSGQTRIEVFFNDPAIPPMKLDVTVSAPEGTTEILSRWCERMEKAAWDEAQVRVSVFLFQNRIFVKGYVAGRENSHALLSRVQEDFLTLKKASPSLEVPNGKMILVNLLTVR